ncbi:Aste57867_22751 [Aphanomyces stellatus]|uniref:Aste57867_22751 protein n=1 Tax=Aphanomyces stellatus TaxID=120398 RepID=A0A485LKS2_9STRA|nr:hypothetical protein As57867_022681 [Aphanomyces stellatus]VFT99404.1 Aste57867_22751 [Aphanomyces stellatus]
MYEVPTPEQQHRAMAKEEILPDGAVRVKFTEKRDAGKKEEGMGIILVRDALWMKTAQRKFAIAFKDIQDLQVNSQAATKKRYMMRFRVRQSTPATYMFEFSSEDELQRTKLQLSQRISQPAHASSEGTTDAERKQRALLLQKHPNTLKRQYTDMVTGGLISDADFWNLPIRKQLLLAENAKRQKTGKTSEILSDVQGENQSGGKSVKYNLNPEIIHQIFVQYPVVYMAYQEQVPDKMTGVEFWGLFVKSKYAHRDSAKAMAAAHQEDMFTRYEEKFQTQRRAAGPPTLSHVDPLVDLSASYALSKGPDTITDTSLAKFNRHAADVLQVKQTTLSASLAKDSIAAAVEMDDLQLPPSQPVLPLNLDNTARYFEHEEDGQTIGAGGVAMAKWQASQVALERMMLSQLDLAVAFPHNAARVLDDVLKESDETNALDQANKQADTRFISSDFKTQLTNHFHDVSELLRHYLSFKAKAQKDGTAEARGKLERIKAKMGDKFEHLERIRNKLPPAEKTTLAPLLTPFLDQLNIPFLEDDSKGIAAGDDVGLHPSNF